MKALFAIDESPNKCHMFVTAGMQRIPSIILQHKIANSDRR